MLYDATRDAKRHTATGNVIAMAVASGGRAPASCDRASRSWAMRSASTITGSSSGSGSLGAAHRPRGAGSVQDEPVECNVPEVPMSAYAAASTALPTLKDILWERFMKALDIKRRLHVVRAFADELDRVTRTRSPSARESGGSGHLVGTSSTEIAATRCNCWSRHTVRW